MDQHQPAYWLSRGPEEAAGFLARTAVASRTVGGFVKTAAGLDPHTQEILTNAALGAGVGGLGGLGVGLFSNRKKNPLSTALTGAALGGVTFAALPEAWRAGKGLLADPPPAAAAAAAAKPNRLGDQLGKAYRNAWLPRRIGYQLGIGTPSVPEPDAATPPAELEGLAKEMAKDTPEKLTAETTKAVIGTPLAWGANAIKDNPLMTAYHGLLTSAQAAHLRNRYLANKYQNFEAGVPGLPEPKPGKGPVSTKTDKSRTVADPANPRFDVTQKNVTTKTDAGTAATHPQSAAAAALRAEMEARVGEGGFGSAGRMWRQAQQARILNKIMAGKGERFIGPLEAGQHRRPHVSGVAPGTVNAAMRAGITPMSEARAKLREGGGWHGGPMRGLRAAGRWGLLYGGSQAAPHIINWLRS